MIILRFKTKEKELMFFKDLHFLSNRFGYGIKFGEMVNDLDLREHEKSSSDVDRNHEE